MTLLRSIWADLVEKRLWPVAALLVAALVAVPFLISRSGGEVAAPIAQIPGATGATPATAMVVALDDTGTPVLSRKGKVRDPFVQQHVPKDPTVTATITSTIPEVVTPPAKDEPAPSSGGSSPAPSTGGSSPAPSTGGSSSAPSTPSATPLPAPAPVKPAAPKADPQDLFRLDLRFGLPGQVRKRPGVARLTPLPSPESPVMVFIGVLKDRETAVFLLSADVTPTGDGTCRPSKSECETLELKAGDTEFLDVAGEGSSVRQYQVDLVKVRRQDDPAAFSTSAKAGSATAADAAVARAAATLRAREARAGRRALKAAAVRTWAAGGTGYRFDATTGFLRRVARVARVASSPLGTTLRAAPSPLGTTLRAAP